MAHVTHKFLLVCGEASEVAKAHQLAQSTLPQLTTPIVPAMVNGTASFMVASSGSRTWRETDTQTEQQRKQLIQDLKTLECDLLYLQFGADQQKPEILDHHAASWVNFPEDT